MKKKWGVGETNWLKSERSEITKKTEEVLGRGEQGVRVGEGQREKRGRMGTLLMGKDKNNKKESHPHTVGQRMGLEELEGGEGEEQEENRGAWKPLRDEKKKGGVWKQRGNFETLKREYLREQI